jgi:hypothetical protein
MSLRSTTITGEGRANRRRIETAVFAFLAVIVIAFLFVEFGRRQTGSGPDGSAFVTDRNGTAALAELVDRLGLEVIPYTAPFGPLDPDGTVMILDPMSGVEYDRTEIEALSDFVEGGGRLVVSGRPHPGLSPTLLPDDLDIGYLADSSSEIVTPLRGVGGVISTEGVRSVELDESVVLAGDPPVAIAFSRGAGTVVYLSDGTILHNERIRDNAAWVVSVLAEGPVRFDEVRHGYAAQPASESPTGLLAALPTGVRAAALLLVPVLVVGLVVYGRRFGPPEHTERDLAPPRRELVDAVAGLLSRTDDPIVAAAPLTARLRATVARQAGLPPGSSTGDLVAAATGLGVDPTSLSAALDPTGEDDQLAGQNILAHLSEREHP